MIVIERAVLHLLDTEHQQKILSSVELPLDSFTTTFLLAHIEKCLRKPSAKRGHFYQNSGFQSLLQEYLKGKMDFIAFSGKIASDWYDILVQVQDMPASDLFICDLTVDGARQIALLRSANHTGVVHQVISTPEGGICTTIQNAMALLPSPAQSFDEFSFIDTSSFDVLLSAKRCTIDGNSLLALAEVLLECDPSPSPREAIQTIQKTAGKVAEEFGTDPIRTAALVKTAIAEEMEQNGALDPIAVGQAVFSQNPSMQISMEKELQSAGFDKMQPIVVDKNAALKKLLHHRLKTDTGIELTVPVEYFDNTEYMEFNKAADGSLSITLKHITNLINRTS